MPKLIAGNWKMNGLGADARREAAALAAGIGAAGDADLLLCPPATLVATLRAALDAAGLGARIAVGGQDCHPAAGGAHTGDVSAAMLADLGCTHVIVGHSERRADHGESDALVRAKAGAAHQAGLVAIVCVGETEAEYRAGETLAVLGRQVGDSLPDAATPANTVIAYEPVWAIGSGLTPTPADIAAAHARIRDVAAIQGIRILYGGSVKPGNAAALLGIAGVDGALVGGASLKAADFLGIAAAAPN